MQFFVRDQHDAVVKIKYRKEFISRYAKFVYYNYNLVCESVKLCLSETPICQTLGRQSEANTASSCT